MIAEFYHIQSPFSNTYPFYIAWSGRTEYNTIMINWDAVKKELLQREGINAVKDAGQKRMILMCAEDCLKKQL